MAQKELDLYSGLAKATGGQVSPDKGKNSWYLQLPDIPSRLKAILTLQNQVQLPCGHSPHVECPDLLAEAIQECLGSDFIE